MGGDADYAYSVAIQNDGKIVAAGYSYGGIDWDFPIIRYLGNPVVALTPIYYLLQ